MRPASILRTLGCAGILLYPVLATAQTAPPLGTAQSFAVLGGSTVTNTGSSVITGDLGVSPGSAVTGFPPGLVVGTIHTSNSVALQAQNDVTIAYNSLAAQGCTVDLTGQDLGGRTLLPNVYCFSSSAQLTGTLTLDFGGNPNAVFIFKTGSTLTTASNAVVNVINGGQNCNVFWQIGSSATLGTGTTFVGNVLALTSITMTTGARSFGRMLARNGAVTLDSNTIDRSACVLPPTPGTCPALALAPATVPNPVVAVPYTQTFTASGGTAPYTFTITAGAPPAGLILTAAGVLSGTPTVAGPSTFTVRATDSLGCFVERTYSVVTAAAPPVPTLTEWATIVLMLLLGCAGVLALRRRRAL